MAPHRFHRSVGTRSDKGEWLGCFVLNGVDRQGTGRIGYHCSARQGLVAHDHFTATPILLPAYAHHIAHFSSVTSVYLQCNPVLVLHWGYTDYLRRFHLFLMKYFFPLKAVSPFIAHRAAIITIPLSSFFRDEE